MIEAYLFRSPLATHNSTVLHQSCRAGRDHKGLGCVHIPFLTLLLADFGSFIVFSDKKA
jgi:hypothetical protein